MSETIDTIKHIAEATTREFNAHRYSQFGSILTLERQNLFSREGYYKEVFPFSLYRRSCMFLTARHIDEDKHSLLSRLFGLNSMSFQKEVDFVASCLRASQSKITPILTNIEARAGLIIPKIPEPVDLKVIEPNRHLIAQQIEQIYQNRKNELAAQQPVIIECDNEDVSDNKPIVYSRIGFKNITEAVRQSFNDHYKTGLTYQDVTGPERKTDKVLCRSFAMYTAAYCLPLENGSYPNIGRYFGGRDHTTAIHAVNKIADKVLNKDAASLKILGEACETLKLSPLQQQAVMGVQKMSIRSWSALLATINAPEPSAAPETEETLNEIAAKLNSPALNFMMR